MPSPTPTVADLQNLMARGWPGTATARLGDWHLRTGGGYSGRANSCHPTGDPGMPLPDAVAEVEEFYSARGLTPQFQIAWQGERPNGATGELDSLLAGRGWRIVTPTVSMVAPRAAAPSDADVRWAPEPDATWLGFEPSDHPARVPVLTATPAHYATLRHDGTAAGCGRLVVTDDWAGISCLFVAPELRGKGLGRALTASLMARGRELGANNCYLQVVRDNAPARALYDSLGFTEHHQYHYRVAP